MAFAADKAKPQIPSDVQDKVAGKPSGLDLVDQRNDPRLTNLRSLHQGSGFIAPTDKAKWQERAEYVRQQMLIAAGLWPMPEKTPLNPVIHGKIDREDYTIEKVFFESYPGLYVSGNLYRPKNKTGPLPAVLSPHGHWANGRLYQTPDKELEKQLKSGLEKDEDAGRYPLQARAANLAKLGCIVFFYDMVGYADAAPNLLPHRNTMTGVKPHLYGLSVFGLQTWDSIRALDFLLSLPDVDPNRIACTGASGGGTQTFVMMAADPRLKVAAPVCMISAGEHQGGCVCENAPLLRIGTDNVEIAATFAPKPFVHPTATGDWTKDFMEKGYPEIKAIYKLFDAESNVFAARFEAPHNYALNNRETVYTFFNTQLKLGHPSPVKEQKFVPVPPAQLSVFDDAHPRPSNAMDAASLEKSLIDRVKAQADALRPSDAASLKKYREVVTPALRHMLATNLPASDAVAAEKKDQSTAGPIKIEQLVLSRRNSPERVPTVCMIPPNAGDTATIILFPQGRSSLMKDGAPDDRLNAFFAKGHTIISSDIFMSGDLRPPVLPPTPKIEFIDGYNRTTLANRVHDILTTIAFAHSRQGIKNVNLVGIGANGVPCLLARAIAGSAVARLAASYNGFDFDQVTEASDDNYLPSGMRFGGFWALAALGAPGETIVLNSSDAQAPAWLTGVYGAAGAADKIRFESMPQVEQVIEWLVR